MKIFEVTYINPDTSQVEIMVKPGKDYDTVNRYLKRRNKVFQEYTLREIPNAIWTQYGPVNIIPGEDWTMHSEDLCYYGTIEDMDLYIDREGNLYGIYF